MIIKKSGKDERREKIIDVAFRLFVDKKIESVTMGEIRTCYCGKYKRMERIF